MAGCQCWLQKVAGTARQLLLVLMMQRVVMHLAEQQHVGRVDPGQQRSLVHVAAAVHVPYLSNQWMIGEKHVPGMRQARGRMQYNGETKSDIHHYPPDHPIQ